MATMDSNKFTDLDIKSLCSFKGNKFLFLNIRSLISNINVFKAEFDNTLVDVIGLSETWSNPRISDVLLNLEGYSLVRWDRSLKKRGGGVALYLNKNLNYEIAPDKYNVSIAEVEMLSVYIRYPRHKDFLITVVYIPSNTDQTVSMESIFKCSELLDANRHHWVIGGDFNLDYLGRAHLKNDKIILNNLERQLNIKQVITSPSRTTTKTASLIDLIFTSNQELVSESGTVPCNISDHDLIFIVFKKKSINTKKASVYYEGRQMSNYTTSKCHSKLENYDWNEFYTSRSPTDCWNLLYKAYLKVLNEICPIKS